MKIAEDAILGRITLGAGSVIGGNVWLTHSVPPGSNVRQAKEENQIDLRSGEVATQAYLGLGDEPAPGPLS
mgnify:CR=1 FL=1